APVKLSADNGATATATVTTDAAGVATATIISKTAGTVTVTATIGSSSRSVNVTFVADSSTAQIGSGDLVVVTDNAVADGTATNSVKATVKDANGNVLSGQTVNFTAGNGATVAASGTTDANGEVTVTVTGTTAGTAAVTESTGSSSRSVNVTFVADSSTAQIGSGDPVLVTDNVVADGTATNS